MHRVRNIGELPETAVRELSGYLEASPDSAAVANLRKGQFIFQTETLIVKVYHHRTLAHRLASWLDHANADRYAAISALLANNALSVPKPMLLVKKGSGWLPDMTLLAMTRLSGKMLLDKLAEIENDPARIAILAPKIAGLFAGLRRARVIHRDLSTKNILITPDNELGLIDFDFSRRFRGGDAAFARKHQRDLEFFTTTCRLSPRLAEAVLAQTSATR